MFSQVMHAQNKSGSENYTITIGAGTSLENTGVLGNSGLVLSLAQQTAILHNLSLKTQFNYARNNFIFEASGSIPESYRKVIDASITEDDWYSYMITFGPTYSLGFKHTVLNLNTGLGLIAINSPIQNINIADGENYGLALFGGNNGGILYNIGIDFQYIVSKNVRLFFETSYNSTFSDVVQWKEKDVTKAFVNDRLDERTFQLLSYESKSQKYSNLLLKIGVGIAFNTCDQVSKKGYDYYKSSSDMKSTKKGYDYYKSSSDMKSATSGADLSGKVNIKDDGENNPDSVQIKANINTSRSNIKQQKQTDTPDSLQLKANHNTARSNKSTIKGDDLNSPDSVQVKANINTSRSNIKKQKQTDTPDSLQLKANHNTTRSNKSTIKDDDINSPDSVQIKANINTSRSNIKK
jgi:hypothetical protein